MKQLSLTTIQKSDLYQSVRRHLSITAHAMMHFDAVTV